MKRQTQTTCISLALTAGAVAAAGVIGRAIVHHRRYMKLRRKVVLITGGSRGLGLVLAREAIAQGAKVAICSRGEQELKNAHEELRGRGGTVLAVQCDVTDPVEVNHLVLTVKQLLGEIDVVINNAGVMTIAPMEYMSINDYQESIRTHLGAALYTTMAVLPSMQRRGRGRIVNVASIGGKLPIPHMIPYCAGKAALVGFSESLRAELAQQGIFVTTVVPGLMRTGSPRNVDVKGQVTKEYAWFATADVAPLVSIDPRRVARRILHAASVGQAELILPWTARLASWIHGLFPGLCTEATALASRLLPDAGHPHDRQAKGFESESSRIPSFAQRRNNQAASANNEFAAPESIF